MKRATVLPLVASCCLFVNSFAFAAAPGAPQGKPDDKSPTPQTPAQGPAEREKLEKAFAEKLTGATLVGHFTVDGREGQREERYEIKSVRKMAGDLWVLTARVQYGQRDVTVPIPLPVRWAGDTPVISLTDATIPGLGTYTARVLFHGDQYAGTWRATDHGGHLWGRIEKAAGAKPEGAGEKAGGDKAESGSGAKSK